METQQYIIAWAVYLAAAAALTVIGWKVLSRFLWREFAYLLEGFLIAILFTPWYVLPDQEILAPAFIVFLLDTITQDALTGLRALIPLVMAMLLALIVTLVLSIIYRIGRRKRRTVAE